MKVPRQVFTGGGSGLRHSLGVNSAVKWRTESLRGNSPKKRAAAINPRAGGSESNQASITNSKKPTNSATAYTLIHIAINFLEPSNFGLLRSIAGVARLVVVIGSTRGEGHWLIGSIAA